MALLICWPVSVAAQDAYVVGDCSLPQAEAILETGNVRARIFNNGALFWRRSPNIYEIPKGSGKQAIFSTNLVAAGFVNDELRAAGSTYGPYEYWPGPISSYDNSPTDCELFDRFWHLSYKNDFRRVDEAPRLTENVASWPVHLGARFLNLNEIPGYQPEDGDLPFMNGDHQYWWVMNDLGNDHARFKTTPLGVEVRASAFGFDATSDIGNVTFYRYEFVNRGSATIRDMVVGLHQDIDLGDFGDDYVGSDTTLSMLYVYNADNEDGDEGHTYGVAPPAIGFTILEASHAAETLPSDRNAPPSAFMTSSRNIYGGGGATGDPVHGLDIYRYMIGQWKDGVEMTEGGGGRVYGGRPMAFWMPGDPVTGAFWSEKNVDGRSTRSYPSDRKSILSFGTFDLAPDEWARFTFAIAWARGTDHLDSVSRLRLLVSRLHESKHQILAPRLPKAARFVDGNPPESPKYPFWVDEPYPNPTSEYLNVRASLDKSGPAVARISDMLGRTHIVKPFVVDAAGQHDFPLDISGLIPGSYAISLESWGRHVTYPFVVMR